MDLETLTQKAATAFGQSTDFDKTVKFDFGDIGKLFLDGPNGTVNNDDAEADATMVVDWDDFIQLAKGKLDPTMAFMSGKVKILGDMSVIMKLQNLVKTLL